MKDSTRPDAPDGLTLAQSFSRAIREHLERLRQGEHQVRQDGDLEGVHLMRTSSRRLRATIKYLGDPLPRAARRSLAKRLAELMTALSQVRDLDVLRRSLDTVPGLEAPGADSLRQVIEERLAQASEAMRRAIDAEAYAGLLSELEKAADVADDGTPVTWAGAERTAAALSEALRNRPADWTRAPEESLHDLRKAVKKIRYALEAFAPAYGRPVARAIERCRELQEALGVIQDAAAFAEHLGGIPSFAAGQFVATARARAEGEVGRLGELWDKAFGPKAQARLGAHLFRRAVRSRADGDASEGRREAV